MCPHRAMPALEVRAMCRVLSKTRGPAWQTETSFAASRKPFLSVCATVLQEFKAPLNRR